MASYKTTQEHGKSTKQRFFLSGWLAAGRFLRNVGVLGLAASCTKSPFQNTQGNFSYRGVNQVAIPETQSTVSQTGGAVGALALSVGTQMVTRLEADLKAGGLSPDQSAAVVAQARGEMQAEAGKVVISTLRETALWLENHAGINLLDQTTSIMGVMASAVARGAVKSLAGDSLKSLPDTFKLNAVGLMSSSVMGSMSVSPQKLSDSGITSIAGTLMDTMIGGLPGAGFSGDQLLNSMSKVMEKGVGALDEAGLSAGATGATMTSMTQSSLLKGTEITKGTSIAGSMVGFIASAAISGLSSTGVSASDSISAVENVTKASVKSAAALDSTVDLAKSIETLTNMATKAMAGVTAGQDVVSGLERLVTAATQAVAEATTKTSSDLFAKMTAGIVSGSVGAVDSVAEKSGKGAASLVQTMVTTTASTAAQAAPASMVVNMLTEVTGSAIKALSQSSFAADKTMRSQAVSGAIQGSVTALSKVSSQDSSMSSSGIQGISRAGTAAAATITTNAADLSAMTNQIMSTGIATMNTTMAGGDSTRLVSLASDMARGAASGMASSSSEDMSRRVNELAATAVTAMNTIATASGNAASILTSFASSMAGAITAGLAVGGQSSSDITALNASLSTSIIQSVVVYAPTINTESLKTQVDSQASAGADLASSISAGGLPLCQTAFNDSLSDSEILAKLGTKRTGVYCKVDVALPMCPMPRRLDQGDYFWAGSPPDLCELRAVPVATNTVATTMDGTTLSTATSTGTGIAGMPPPPVGTIPPMGTSTSTGTGTGTMGGFLTGPTFAHFQSGAGNPDNTKGFYSEAHDRHWIMVPTSTGVEFKWSDDNTTWTFGSDLNIGTGEVALDYLTSPSGTVIVVAAQVGTNIDVYLGTVDASTISFNSPITPFSSGISQPTVAVSPSAVWVGGVRELGSAASGFRYEAQVKKSAFSPATPSLSFSAHQPIAPAQNQIHSIELLGAPSVGAYLVVNGDEIRVYQNLNNSATWDPIVGADPKYFAATTFPMKSTSWSVYATKFYNNKLYVGGDFETMGGVPGTRHVAVYDFTAGAWQALDNGFDGTVYALAVDAGGNLYAGGSFSHAGTKMVNGIARWDNGQWHSLGQGFSGASGPGKVYAILPAPTAGVFPSGIYIGGDFMETFGPSMTELNNVAFWDGTSFLPLAQSGSDPGVGFMGVVYALEKNGVQLYVGGESFTLPQLPSNSESLAQYDLSATTWSKVGESTNFLVAGIVRALKFYNTKLYVGGQFTTADFTSGMTGADNIVRLDLASAPTWVAMGSGMSTGADDSVHTFDLLGTYLFVGGQFATANGSASINFAKYDTAGSSWYGFSSGTDGTVYALASDGSSDLYIGGKMFMVNNQHSPGVGKYSSGSLTAFDTNPPLNGKIYDAVSMTNGDIYVGGDFTTIGGVNAARFARWDHTNKVWTAVGSGCDNTVYALDRDDGSNEIFLGGAFSNCDGASNYGLAKYNTSNNTWVNYTDATLGSGTTIYGMEFDSTVNLYIIGEIIGTPSKLVQLNTSNSTFTSIAPPADWQGSPRQIAITDDDKVILGRSYIASNLGVPFYNAPNSSWGVISTTLDVNDIYSIWAGTTLYQTIIGGSFAEVDPANASGASESGLGFVYYNMVPAWQTVSPIYPNLPPNQKINAVLKTTIGGTDYLLVGGEIHPTSSPLSSVSGFGIYNLSTFQWDTSLSVQGEIKKIIPGEPGSPLDGAFILVGMFNAIGGMPSSGIAIVRPSHLGTGTLSGVGAALNPANGEINLMIPRDHDLFHSSFSSGSWVHSMPLGDSSAYGPVSYPEIMTYGTDVHLMWIQDGEIRSQSKMAGAWGAHQLEPKGTFVERLFLDHSLQGGTVKLLYGDAVNTYVTRAN